MLTSISDVPPLASILIRHPPGGLHVFLQHVDLRARLLNEAGRTRIFQPKDSKDGDISTIMG